ncbi:MAG: ABC transporter substrate-binding protein [Solirubrobacteraceae bacterium]
MNRILLVALVASTVALAACGEKQDPAGVPGKERITLMLDFLPNADHAGIYEAVRSGEFEKAGLDVQIQVPGDPSSPLKLLQAGKTDLAISYEPEVFLARDKGAQITSIGALVSEPLTSIIAIGKDTKLDSAADLEGHTVGTAGIPYQSAYLKTILEEAGADPARGKEVNVGFGLVPAMLSKKVYATLGGFWNYEGVQLQRKKRDPKIIRVDQAGVPTYDELVIVARTAEVRDRAATLRRFLQALARAHAAVRDDPAAGADALIAENPDLDPGLQREAVAKTVPAFFPSESDRPWGWQNTRQWEAYGKWMEDNDLLTQPPSASALSNDLLPGEGF